MARSTALSQKPAFLPAGMKLFMRRRAEESVGVVLILIAAFLIAALVGFDPQDPSFNRATGEPIRNLMGLPGAYLSDLLLQTIGLGAALLAIVPLAWGWRIISHRGLPWFWLHLTLLPVTLLLAAGAAATVTPPVSWPLPVGLGGLLGGFLLGWLVVLSQAIGVTVDLWVHGLALGAAALLAFLLTLGITQREWSTAAVTGRDAAVRAVLFAIWVARLAYHYSRVWWDRIFSSDDDDAPVVQQPAEPRMAPPAPKMPAARTGSEPLVETRHAKPRAGRREAAERQTKLKLGGNEEYELPPLALLQMPKAQSGVEQVNAESLQQNARILESVLEDFGVHGEIVKVRPGPVVTLYELEPAPGTKSSRVIGLADDIARSMSALSARVSVIPGRNAMGIELPNASRETVFLRELFATADYENAAGKLTLALGKDIGGTPVFADLSRMPHLLIAGTTGSGKSVAVNTMILSLLYHMSPEQCRLILIDPKMLELSVYDGIPHLLSPVVTDPSKAIVALKWTVREMENRYRKMSELGVRNIASYNQRVGEAKTKGEDLRRTVQTGFDGETGEPVFEDRPLDMEPLPLIVVVVDEMADLMMVAGKDIEGAIQRLAQMARAAGIHLIMATQRPSVDVITGTIKANFPTRISFQVTSKIDSRTILGEPGAEQLLGAGDMLFMPGAGRVSRVHGPFVSDDEVEEVVKFLKTQGAPDYLEDITADTEGSFSPGGGGSSGGDGDTLYDRAVDLVAREQKASTSFIQRHLQIGYNRAARIIEQMEAEGIIGAANHVGKREVLARQPDEFE